MTAFIHIVPEWLELVSLAFCVGALVFRLWILVNSTISGFSSGEGIVASLWRVFGICLAVMIVSSIAELLVRASDMSGQSVSMAFPLIPTVIARTHAGQVWLIRIAALILLSLMVKAGRRHRDSRGFLFFMLGFAVLVSMTESASGHASDKGDFSLPEIVDWLHLMASSVWGGGLLVLSLVVLPALVGKGDSTAPLIADVARRFSAIAGFAVGVIGLTALYNSLMYVGSVGAFWSTSYGWAAAAKIFLFGFILYFGAFNRYVSVPLLQECARASSESLGIIERIAARVFPQYLCTRDKTLISVRFSATVKVEAVLLVGILLCAAFLRHDIPARHASHLQHQGGKGHSMPHHDSTVPRDHSDDNKQRH